MQLRRPLLVTLAVCSFSLVYALAAVQDRSAQPQTRPAPGEPRQGGTPPGGANLGGEEVL
jgi:hypothetical protein